MTQHMECCSGTVLKVNFGDRALTCGSGRSSGSKLTEFLSVRPDHSRILDQVRGQKAVSSEQHRRTTFLTRVLHQ